MAKKDEQVKEVVAPVVETSESTALATTTAAPVGLARADYGDDEAGAGFEDMTAEDFSIPFLSILQKGSPEVEEDSPKRIEGAKAGMLINSVTKQLYDGKVGIEVIAVHRKHEYIEWIPRNQGGGFVNRFDPTDPFVIKAKQGGKFGKLQVNDGNELAETFNVFALIVREDGTFQRVLIGFASSQIKKYKDWMTVAQGIQHVEEGTGRIVTPPLYSHVYHLRTAFNQNKKGTWYGWEITFKGGDAEKARLPKTHPLYTVAKEFRNIAVAGKVDVDYSKAAQDSATEDKDEF